jgi:tubulin polyglutamylase TTLL1
MHETFSLTSRMQDLLVKNIKRHQRSLKRDGGPAEDIIPSTFVLPQDYALFVEVDLMKQMQQQSLQCLFYLSTWSH